MRNFSSKSGWNIGGETTTATTAGGGSVAAAAAQETDPLIRREAAASSSSSYIQSSRLNNNQHLRERRSTSRSPITTMNPTTTTTSSSSSSAAKNTNNNNNEPTSSYTRIQDDGSSHRSGNMSLEDNSGESSSYQNSTGSVANRSLHSLRRSYLVEKAAREAAIGGGGSMDHPPLLEIPEEIYGVRKAALQVLKPLTRTWLIVSVGFAMTVLFGMARWTRLLPNLPFWFILLPSWLSHVGLFWCHITSAKALSSFIAEANESRQRPDSRDHLDRTEYLPLLQRSLKFGLKTGLISFGIFIFEILIYCRLARNRLSLSICFLPIWIMVFGGIVDGIICRTQHFMRLICWVLVFVAMILLCLKVDYGHDAIRWRMIVSPIVTVLSIASATLIYIVYGHQVGYYRLTESQLTAGNLYSLAALISIVLVVVIGEVIPLSRPVEIETRVFVVLMAPLVVVLVGMGAWVVSRDEFGRLLLYGGQAQVHPRKLRWEAKGWTTVQGRGVTNIPMFGEVSFRPLEQKPTSSLEMCACCTCYPYEEDEEEMVQYIDDVGNHPYLAPVASNPAPSLSYMQWQGAAQAV